MGLTKKYANQEVFGELTANKFTIAGEYSLPISDGTSGQVLVTDGAGNVTFQSVTSTGALVASTIINGTGLNWTYLPIPDSLQGNVTLAPFSTTDLAEGSNLYFTNERVDDRINTMLINGTGILKSYNDPANTLTLSVTLAPFTTTNLAEGTNLYFTNERVDDRTAALLQPGLAGSGANSITWNYSDALNTLTPTVSLVPFTTSNLAEGANLYFTDERVDDRVALLIQNSATVTWTYNDGLGTLTANATGSGGYGIIVLDSGTGSSVRCGNGNTASANYSTVSGGFGNTASCYSATIAGGGGNTASDYFATVGGGNFNDAGQFATVGGGGYNTSSGYGSFIGGGGSNTSSGSGSVVAGGTANAASSGNSTVGGGTGNTVSAANSTVSGGYTNTASSLSSTVGGGSYNTACNIFSTISGGSNNLASGLYSFIGGGQVNTASCDGATIAGGSSNSAGGIGSVVSGGVANCTAKDYTTVSGGYCNCALENRATVGGGIYNSATGCHSIVNGGNSNTSSGHSSTTSGGDGNVASCCYSTISGGYDNISSGLCSTVAGGAFNVASCTYASVSGGQCNTASCCGAFIGGGECNTASGTAATIGGGRCNTASFGGAFIGGGGCNVACCAATVVAGGKYNCATTGGSAILGGACNTASGCYSTAGGSLAIASRYGERTYAAGKFSTQGDAQHVQVIARSTTDGFVTQILYLDGVSSRFTLLAGQIFSGTINILGVNTAGTVIARYLRQITISNIGGTTTLPVGSEITLGTDIASSTSIAITADDINDALRITVTGVAGSTISWIAHIAGVQISI
jgi:hypothetical protein